MLIDVVVLRTLATSMFGWFNRRGVLGGTGTGSELLP
jgi:hypothetical protein